MFKHINNFDDSLTNRLVYMGLELVEEPNGKQEKAGAAAEGLDVSPEALQAEADALGKEIDSYIKEMDQDINLGKTGEERIKIDLDHPESYESLREPYRSVIITLAEAKEILKNEAPTRVNLNTVRVKMDAAEETNVATRKAGDPLMDSAEMGRVAAAQPERKKEKAPEVEPKSDWVRMAELVDEYRESADEAKADLGLELVKLAKANMGAAEYREYAAGDANVLVSKAPGKEAYLFVTATRLDPSSPAMSAWEHVYIGGTSEDFPADRTPDQLAAKFGATLRKSSEA